MFKKIATVMTLCSLLLPYFPSNTVYAGDNKTYIKEIKMEKNSPESIFLSKLMEKFSYDKKVDMTKYAKIPDILLESIEKKNKKIKDSAVIYSNFTVEEVRYRKYNKEFKNGVMDIKVKYNYTIPDLEEPGTDELYMLIDFTRGEKFSIDSLIFSDDVYVMDENKKTVKPQHITDAVERFDIQEFKNDIHLPDYYLYTAKKGMSIFIEYYGIIFNIPDSWADRVQFQITDTGIIFSSSELNKYISDKSGGTVFEYLFGFDLYWLSDNKIKEFEEAPGVDFFKLNDYLIMKHQSTDAPYPEGYNDKKAMTFISSLFDEKSLKVFMDSFFSIEADEITPIGETKKYIDYNTGNSEEVITTAESTKSGELTEQEKASAKADNYHESYLGSMVIPNAHLIYKKTQEFMKEGSYDAEVLWMVEEGSQLEEVLKKWINRYPEDKKIYTYQRTLTNMAVVD